MLNAYINREREMSVKTATELMLDMENELITLLIKYMTAGDMEQSDWQYKKLQQFGMFNGMATSVNKKRVPEILQAAQDEVKKIALEKAKQIDKNVPADRLADAIPIGTSDVMKAAILQYQRTTMQYFVSASNTMLRSAGQMYTDTVNQVLLIRSTKAITGRQAMAQIAEQWASTGVTSFKDKANRSWSTEAYSQMIVRTQSVQAGVDAQLARLDDLDCDLVEISSHIGARPKCEPYQGKVFSRTGKTKGYPLLSDTSYGEIDGLFGINCGHNMFPYFPGTEKTYQPYGKKENEQVYENSQKQRLLERNIRAAKKNVDYQKKIGNDADVQKAQNMLKLRNAQMESFIGQTGRTRREGREEIYN